MKMIASFTWKNKNIKNGFCIKINKSKMCRKKNVRGHDEKMCRDKKTQKHNKRNEKENRMKEKDQARK